MKEANAVERGQPVNRTGDLSGADTRLSERLHVVSQSLGLRGLRASEWRESRSQCNSSPFPLCPRQGFHPNARPFHQVGPGLVHQVGPGLASSPWRRQTAWAAAWRDACKSPTSFSSRLRLLLAGERWSEITPAWHRSSKSAASSEERQRRCSLLWWMTFTKSASSTSLL